MPPPSRPTPTAAPHRPVSSVGRRRRRPGLGSTLLLTGSLVLSGCGTGTSAGSATPSTSSTPSTSATSAIPSTSATPVTASTTASAAPSDGATAGSATLAVSVTGSTVTPAPSTVQLAIGQTLVLTVTSDHADEIHAHGFEVEVEVGAGESARLVLTGTEPGVYEVEMHHPALTVLKVAVS